ncbi:MAG TPA: hypothetical protein VNO50_05550 [Pyrinomonadaceae bacterium]|nr:hypothetical protein [Pyrinomonadaceae bacterium]
MLTQQLLTQQSLTRRWCFLLLRQAALAITLAGVAHGFVQRAVRAMVRVGTNAVDDELHLGENGLIGGVARGQRLGELIFKVFDLFTCRLAGAAIAWNCASVIPPKSRGQ